MNCCAFAKVALEAGEVVIRPLEEADIGGAAVLLTRCFGHIDGRNITEIRSRPSVISKQLACNSCCLHLLLQQQRASWRLTPAGSMLLKCLIAHLMACS